MTTKEPYGVEKDLKVLEGRSEAHSARLRGQFLGIFPAPEIDIIPQEEEKKSGKKGMVVTGIEDMELKIDLDVRDLEKDKGPMMELLHLIGLDPREADFDVLTTLEKVIRAFAKARFKNLAEVTFDGQKVYQHPELEMDIRKVLGNIKELDHDFSGSTEAGARILQHDEGDTEVRIKVDKVHTRFSHDIEIEIDGRISGEMLRRVINYLEENLDIREMLNG